MYPSSLLLHENVDLDDIDMDDIVQYTDGEPPVRHRQRTPEEIARDKAAKRGSVVFYTQATMMYSLEHRMQTMKKVKAAAKARGIPVSDSETWLHEKSHFPVLRALSK